MADQKLVRIIKNEGVEAFNRWRIENIFNPNLIIDLSDANFTDYDLTGINLSKRHDKESYIEINLSGVDLSNCNLTKANFHGTDLSNTKMEGAIFNANNLGLSILPKKGFKKEIFLNVNFERAQITDATFDYCNFDQSRLIDVDLSSIDLSTCTFNEVSFSKSHINQTKLTRLNLKNCDFSKTKIRKVDFSGSDLSNSIFDDSQIEETRFINSRLDSISFIESHFIKCELIQSQHFQKNEYNGTKFDECSFSNLDISNNSFQFSVFQQCKFTKTQANSVNFQNSQFSNCSFSEVSFTELIGQKSDWNGSSITKSDFFNANLQQAKFENASFTFARFDKGRLEGAIFNTCEITDTTFEGANLNKAQTDRCKILRVNFNKADLSNASFNTTQLNDIRLDAAELTRAQFIATKLSQISAQNAEFFSATFGEVDLINSQLSNSTLKAANFHAGNLKNTSFDNADLTDARLERSNLKGATFKNTIVRGTNFIGANLDASQLTKEQIQQSINSFKSETTVDVELAEEINNLRLDLSNQNQAGLDDLRKDLEAQLKDTLLEKNASAFDEINESLKQYANERFDETLLETLDDKLKAAISENVARKKTDEDNNTLFATARQVLTAYAKDAENQSGQFRKYGIRLSILGLLITSVPALKIIGIWILQVYNSFHNSTPLMISPVEWASIFAHIPYIMPAVILSEVLAFVMFYQYGKAMERKQYYQFEATSLSMKQIGTHIDVRLSPIETLKDTAKDLRNTERNIVLKKGERSLQEAHVAPDVALLQNMMTKHPTLPDSSKKRTHLRQPGPNA